MSTTLVFATDLHGNAHAYDALFRAAVEQQASAIALGGDLLPHARLAGQADCLRTWLLPRLRGFHEKHPKVSVFGMLGNDDWGVLQRELEEAEREGTFFCLHQRAHKLAEELWIAGSSFVPVTPFGMSDFDRFDAPGWGPPGKLHPPLFSRGEEVVEGTLEEIERRETVQESLAALAKLSPPRRTVYVLHAPPWRTKLDQLFDRTHVGSAAVRKFIEKHRPPVTLHGHIHESPLVSGSISDTIGETLVLNPGDSQTRLRALLVSVGGARVEWRALF